MVKGTTQIISGAINLGTAGMQVTAQARGGLFSPKSSEAIQSQVQTIGSFGSAGTAFTGAAGDMIASGHQLEAELLSADAQRLQSAMAAPQGMGEVARDERQDAKGMMDTWMNFIQSASGDLTRYISVSGRG